MKVLDLKVQSKEVITDEAQLSDWSSEIDPRKEGTEVQKIVTELKKTMKDNGFIYLTAPQIGYKKRIACIRYGKNDYRTYINPVIENVSAFGFEREKCYSIPDKEFIRPRFGSMTMFFTTPLGKVESCKVVGKTATILQHCIDHLDGLLLSDVGLEIDEDFDKLTDEEKQELLKLYAESLDVKHKQLQDAINEDEEAKKIKDAADFIQGVRDGSVQLDKDNEQDEN